MKKEGKQRRARAGRSLNLVIMYAFSALAVVLIVLYALFQNLFVGRQYYESLILKLSEAGEQIAAELSEMDNEEAAGELLLEAGDEYGAAVNLIYADGRSVFSPYGAQRTDPELAEAVRGAISEEGGSVTLTAKDRLTYAAEVTFMGETCYLCLSSSLGPITDFAAGRWWFSLVSAMLAVVLAFAASGMVARLITRPVTEVTDRAKELARGNYDLNFKKDYYCLEISELSEALEHARVEISKADAMQKELIANVSHDFKTPLTMIKAYASMIGEIDGDDREKREKHAEIIIEEADRLSALVNDVLDLSRLRAGVSDEKTVFNLSELVFGVAARFAYLSERHGYNIATEVEEELYTLAGRDRIEQVLYNLIGNAVNYTGEDKRVRVRLFRKGENVRFEVIDTGKGIPKEETETIWDRYYRSTASHRRPVSGTGLGLSIVKGILLAQEFPFGVLSEVGKGSCFWVEFPPPPQKIKDK